MSLNVFLIVLAAALLHAGWNATVKGSGDKVLGIAAVMVGQMLPCFIVLLFLPWPSVESLPWFAAGMVFHFGYSVFLMRSYKIGDFTQVYPIARGTGPMLVTLISVMFLGVELSAYELLAVALIILAIISLSFVKQGDGLRNPKAAAMAFITGCCIAGYSLADGLGARASESAVGFIAMLMFVNGGVFILYLRWCHKGTLRRMVKTGKLQSLGAGTASFVAFALVIWAMTQAPIALVTALRETSIIFAVLIGVLIFREKLTTAKVFSVLLAVAGAILLRFGDGLA